jgi:hypothetical protein
MGVAGLLGGLGFGGLGLLAFGLGLLAFFGLAFGLALLAFGFLGLLALGFSSGSLALALASGWYSITV